jgi:hypothetical protein
MHAANASNMRPTMNDTSKLRFFHGTNAEFARRLANGESNEHVLADLGAFELGDQLAHEIRSIARIKPGEWLSSERFPDADEEDLMLAASVARMERSEIRVALPHCASLHAGYRPASLTA